MNIGKREREIKYHQQEESNNSQKKSSKNQTINQKEELNSNVVRRVDHQHNKSFKKTSTLTSPKKKQIIELQNITKL